MKKNVMNKEILKGKWFHVRRDIRGWWSKLTDDDVDQIQGNTEKFIGKLQERYGYGREQAELALNDFLCLPDNQRRRIRKSEGVIAELMDPLIWHPSCKYEMLFAEEVGNEGDGAPEKRS